ncbi:MAG: DNA repair protein RecO [Firmicutes bacterium]|nr:DNA repair protein RecO [Bacillota bacterium]
MLTDTEGIVLRQIKTSYNRRMILLFSRRYGKISAGTGIGEKGRSKSSLALRPFTYGRYELFKGRDSYNINSAEVLRSFYRIGEDVDKYMYGAYVLEFTEKVLQEEMPAQRLFDLLIEFFEVLEDRQRGIGTLVLAYQTKLLQIMGLLPQLEQCASCGRGKPAAAFSVREGGIICADCMSKEEISSDSTLISCTKFDIVKVLNYFLANPLKKLENIALNEEMGKAVQKLIREYAAYHLDITDIKSEKLL